MKPSKLQLDRLKTTLSMQFIGLGVEEVLRDIEIQVSRKTGRIRGVFDKESGVQLFSLRTADGRFLPTFAGAIRIHNSGYRRYQIIMKEEAVPFVAAGKSAFCRHIKEADDLIRPQSEVFLYSEQDELLAVGTARQPAYAMYELDYGLAAKIKHCRDKS